MDTTEQLSVLPVSPRAEKVLEKACEMALKFEDQTITPTHLVLALLTTESGSHYTYLAQQNIDTHACQMDIMMQMASSMNSAESGFATELRYSDSAREIFALAEEERRNQKQMFLGTQHLLLAVLKHRSPLEKILKKHGLDYAKAQQDLAAALVLSSRSDQPSRRAAEALPV